MKTKKPKHTIVCLHAYVGNDDEAKEYVREIKSFASKCNQTVGDFVLDAVEAYCRSKSMRNEITLKMPVSAPSIPMPKTVDYSELDDPPAPQVDATSIPDSRPKP